jgi:hypothetical protein
MLDQKTRKALVIAAAAPPTIATLLMVIFSIVSAIVEIIDGNIPSGGHDSFITFMTFVVGFIISFSLCFVVGIPVHLLLQRLHLTSILWYVGIASFLTFGSAIYGTGYPNLENTENFFIFVSVFIAFGGPIAATTFWCIARPDLDAPSP